MPEELIDRSYNHAILQTQIFLKIPDQHFILIIFNIKDDVGMSFSHFEVNAFQLLQTRSGV